MKNLSRGILSLCLIGALLLSACGKSDGTGTLSNSEAPSNTTSPAPSTNNTPTNTESLIEPDEKEAIKDITAADFKKGVSIDFDKYKGSFFDDNIISKLRNNLESVVENNKETFEENLNKESLESIREGFYYTNEIDQFMFYDLDLIEKVDQPEQIRVGVRFAKKSSDGSVENQGI
ncbi:hypothetical protein C7121_01045 [Paenibacillus glucanolyticus]|jgi:PBP1b-binding outer membrane lipoprotein LpoB|uniref:hypothetical protein n=1 Tax=Paenibacillus TaxID=44249 RepID=UPI0003E1E47D|nr:MULTISPECIES: hypothetical protein [Paenibacillus]ANA81047.1 hypothetical protein A3958_14165 [Paenibacillus glucanolyticus]AVV54833.1 hypothetical protein C7121_01045 [Paenibacillus glucanolyticus]ETT36388.1 hypothetical protein C169_14179 [Paenibacillus sp. FSL R5-808]MDH6674116.1 PBP1b-binding outer membrane lipoprotein LpoB [Paenibacillus sp. LBL]OMF68497.1 hypothetical protein BK142_27420 [Paenibacillus glucanolyticus]